MVNTDIAPELKLIAEKVKAGQRITDEEALLSYRADECMCVQLQFLFVQ